MWDSLTGVEWKIEKEHTFNQQKNGWYSSYIKVTGEHVSEKKGFITTKYDNFVKNGIRVDLKVMSLDVDFSDGHLNVNPQINLPGDEYINLKLNAGANLDNYMFLPDVNLSIGGGDASSSVDYGIKVTPDFYNGIVGVYSTKTEETPTGKEEKLVKSVETGYQTGDGPTVIIGGLLILQAVRPETTEFVQQVIQKLQEVMP